MSNLVFYVDGTSGADTNSGTTEGSALANGTAATRSGAVYTLDGTPDLSGVTVNQDTIRITGETSGIGYSADLFEITAVDDGADTVTVSPTPTGGTSGLTWAIGGALATVQKGFDSLQANGRDTLWIKDKGSAYSEDVVTRQSGANNYMPDYQIVAGYGTTTGDTGQATITGPTTHGITQSHSRYYYRNLRITGSAGGGIYSTASDYVALYNCKIDSNSSENIRLDDFISIVNCEVYNAGLENLELGNDSCIVGCIFYGAGQYNHRINGKSLFYKNLCYAPTWDNFWGDVSTGVTYVIGNTLDGDGIATGAAIDVNTGQHSIIDNIIHDHHVGIDIGAALQSGGFWNGYNLFSSNTTDATGGYYSYDGTDVTTADPAFTDEANDDYTLQHQSAAVGAGVKPGNIT